MLTSICEKEKNQGIHAYKHIAFFKLSPMNMAKFFPTGVGPVNVFFFYAPYRGQGFCAVFHPCTAS
jgi:hypothetical protein